MPPFCFDEFERKMKIKQYVKIFGFWNKANSTNFCFGAYKVDVMSTLQVQNGTKYD